MNSRTYPGKWEIIEEHTNENGLYILVNWVPIVKIVIVPDISPTEHAANYDRAMRILK